MQKKLVLPFVFLVWISNAQEFSEIRGKIVTDTSPSEAVHIINKSNEKGTISDKSGYFTIKASKGDTLLFSSIQYALKELVVGDEDFNNELLIKLEPSVNALDEVVVTQYSLTGSLEEDLENIPTYTKNLPFWSAAEIEKFKITWKDDAQSPVENLVLKDDIQATPIDFIAIGKFLAKSLKGKGVSVDPVYTVADFCDEKFVVEVLEIPETEYYNFIDFVNEDSRTAFVLKLDDRLKILEYLMDQRDVFITKYGIKK